MHRPLPRSTTYGRSRIEPRLSRVASALIDKPVEVRCWSGSDWRHVKRELRAYTGEERDLSGLAWRSRAHLEGYWCDWLATFPAKRSANQYDAFALKLVAHEAEHIRSDILMEAQVECYAVQHVERAARLLGASPRLARNLANVEWRNYPQNEPDYRSPQCSRGGPLDLTPNDGVWP
jgi:hypothetical protein